MPIYKTGKKKDGVLQYRVQVSYKDAAGQYHKKERTAHGLAEAKIIEMQLRSEAGKATAKKTLNELYVEYVSVKRYELRETTAKQTDASMRLYVLPELGNYDIRKLNLQTLRKWKLGIEERDLATQTKKNIYSAFSAVLNFGVKSLYLPNNPLHLVGNFKSADIKMEELHFYTPEQFEAYIAAAKARIKDLRSYGYYVFFNIAYFTGARKGEINALKWSDIDGDTIRIRRSVAQKLKGAVRETAPKNKSSIRDIRMPDRLRDILSDYRKQYEKVKSFNLDFRVCGGISVLPDTSIDKENRANAEAAGLPHIRVHDFRHSHASLLANEGINIQEVARRLGHSDVQTTWKVYAHLYPREEDRALNVINNIFQ